MKRKFSTGIVILGLLVAFAAPAAALEETLARQVLAEINLARTAPRNYAGFLREFRGRFQGRSYSQPGSRVRVQTSEGVAAVDEAIRYLSRQKPLPALNWSAGLAAAAGELASEQENSGETGHTGVKSRGMRERVERQGKWEGRIGENIAYGPEDARGVVMQLIIDDGVPDRGHRKNHFSPAFGAVGVACGSHPRFGSMCVIDFAGSFKERVHEESQP